MQVDRITFAANFAKHVVKKDPKTGEYTHLDKILAQVQGLGRRTGAKYPYRWQFQTEEGVTIQVADKNAPVKQLRFDFNPQESEFKRVLLPFKNTLVEQHITRIDFCQDYDLNMTRFHFQMKNSVKSCQFRSRTGALETLYLGAKDSALRFRIYNKALEQGQPGTLWRIESQQRFKPKEDWWYAEPFAEFEMHRPVYDDLKIQERAMVDYLVKNPSAWSELSRPARAKYKDLMRSGLGAGGAVIHPHDIYQRECVRLKKGVMDILALTEYKKPLI